MNESTTRKPWYLRVWALLLWGVLILIVLLSVVPIGDPYRDDDAVDLSLHAGSIKANSSLSSSSMTSGSGRAPLFSARRIAVFNRSEHQVLRNVARKLAKRIETFPFVDQVDLYQPGASPQKGALLYDFYILLDLPLFDSSGFLATGRTVEADVHMTVGQGLFHSRRISHDDYSPPIARLQMDSQLEHRSVAHGYETASAKYRQVIDDIEKQLGGGLEKTMTDWSGQFGAITDFPRGLFPAYHPLPQDLPLPQNEGLELLLSGHGLMVRNTSVWTQETVEPAGILEELHARLAAEDWRMDPKKWNPEADSYFHFRATKDSQIYEAFEVRHDYEPHQPGERTRLAFRYSDRMSAEDRQPVFEAMIADENLPPQTGLCFMNMLGQEQNARLIESWIDRGRMPVNIQMEIVRYLHRQTRTEEAAARLRALYVSALIALDAKMDEIVKLGEEVTGITPWEPSPPTLDELIGVGVQQIVSNAVVEVDLGESAMFYVPPVDDEAAVLLGVTVTRSTIPEGRYTLSMHCRDGTRFSGQGSCSSTPHSLDSPWKGRNSYHVNRISWASEATEIGTNRFSIALTPGG